jgi:glycosyltransferase involved in cell wall biosynthesis
MTIPTVSIGLPVYHGENYLKAALDSILSQTFLDFELIISDNASTDNTAMICESYAKADPRVRFHRNERNMGGAWNFNHVFRISCGTYFQWACHDDVWTPTLLERCVEILDRNPEVVLCCTRTTYIDEKGNPLRSLVGRPELCDRRAHRRFGAFLKYHRNPNECNHVLGLFRSGVLKQTPLIGSYPASDMILLGEVALHGPFHEIPECLFLRRDHPLTSVRANPGWEDRAAWFDPSRRGKIQMPRCRWFFEWLRSIQRSPIGTAERVRCAGELWKWARWNRGEMRGELDFAWRRSFPRLAGMR